MKTFVLLALVGLAVASSLSSDRSFRVGNEYRFRFDGQITAGLSLPSQVQQSASRIQALVTVQPVDDRTYYLQLNKISFGSMQSEFQPRQLQTFERFERVELEQEYERMLEMPVRFSYKHGIVGEIEFNHKEQPWSANIKKAVLNMLQVNLLKKGSLEKSEETESSHDFFLATERTLEGDCEVAYTLNEQREKSMQWTKSINFQKCTQRPEIRYGLRNVETCEECEKTMSEEQLSSTVISYNVTGTSENFLIHEVELKSQHMFGLVHEKQQLIGSFVHNKLVLEKVQKVQNEIERVSGERKETLLYNPEIEIAEEKFAMTGDESHLRRLPLWNNKVQHIQKLISQIANLVNTESADLELPHLVARTVKVLRLCTKEEVSEIHNYVYSTLEKDNFEKVRSYYIDCLALAGTKNTIEHLMQKIIKQDVQPIKAAQLFKSLAEIRTPSKEIAEEILNVCESNIAVKSPVVRQSCYLTYGAIINGICGQNKDILAVEFESKKVCPRQLKEEFLSKIWQLFERSESRYEKVLALKTLSNAAIDMSIHKLEKVIYDKQVDMTVRKQAIDAVRRLRFEMPRKIQNMLMPVYKDRSEKPELRMTALSQIMHTMPEKVIIDQIVYTMEQERSQQVRAFTYSLLKTIAESTNVCDKKISPIVARVLSTVSEPEYTRLQSTYKSHMIYNNEYMSGASLSWASLFTNDSVLPKEVMASLETVFGGEWNKYLAQIGFSQHNVDALLSKLLKKVEEEGIDKLVVRGKRSATFSPSDILRSLVEKLRITRRESSQDEPNAMLYIRYKDMDYAILPIDEQSIPEMIKSAVRDGELDLSEIERLLAKEHHFTMKGAFFVNEAIRRIPSALGMPVVLSTRMPTVAQIRGSVKFELEPKNSERFEGLRLRLKVLPTVATTHVAQMEIVSPIVNNGMKLLKSAKIQLPIDTEMELSWADKLVVKTTVHMPEKARRVLHLQTRPATYVRMWKKEMRQYPEPTEQTVYLKESLYPVVGIERSYLRPTGIRMNVRGSIHRPLFTSEMEIPASALIGENMIDVTIEPTEQSPKKVVVTMEVELFKPVSNIEGPRSLEKFFEDNVKIQSSEELFETEDAEYKNEEEPKRRSSFKNYVKSYNTEKGYKHLVRFTVETDRRDMKANALITAVCDRKMRFCRTIVEARRSPMKSENREWELKATIETLYPEEPKTVKGLYEQEHREFQGHLDATWGAEQTNEIKIRLQGEQSREQKQWMERVERNQNRLTEEEKLAEIAKLNQYKIVADYKLSPESKYQMNKLFSLIKVWSFWNTESVAVRNQESRVVAQLTIEPAQRRLFNLTIETPSERVQLHNVKLPVQLPTINIKHLSTPVRSVKQVAERFVSEIRSECVVKSKEVQTFDNVFFKAPLTPCYSVLAKDCSSEEPKFSVLMKKVRKNSEEKKLKVVSRENVIEMELVDEEIKVVVNGKHIKDKHMMEEFGIQKKNDQLYKIDIEDVIVHFDGFEAKIKISQSYKNKQCGVCGHYDDETETEFRKADNEETSDIQKFHSSYLYEDSECERDSEELENKKNFRLISKETSSSEEEKDLRQKDSETDEPVKKVRVHEESHKICFSTEKVPECRRDSEEKKTVQKEVEFKCLRRSETEALRLQRLVRNNRLTLSEVEQIEEATIVRKEIRVPTLCTVY